jgi:hypothetical protein
VAEEPAKEALAAFRGNHPPHPVLTLRVGISGHRPKPDKMPVEAFALVRGRLREVFTAMDDALIAAKRDNKAFYATDPHRVRVVSGLAEGADQFAVNERLPGWEVDAILPFPLESYLHDFEQSAIDKKTDVTGDFKTVLAQADTVVQLPEDSRIARGLVTPQSDEKRYWMLRNQGYANLGRFLLGQCDILVVVWDGLPEDGPGGTATVVRDAVDAGIQVVWISPNAHDPLAMIGSIDDEQKPKCKDGDFGTLLVQAVSTVVSVPPDIKMEGGAHASHGRNVKKRLAVFLSATWPEDTRSVTYDVFRRVCHFQFGRIRFPIPAADIEDAYLKPWTDFANDTPRAGALDKRIVDTLLKRYMWADALAIERSHWYRAAYFNSYLLAALTVGVALFGVFTISTSAEVLLLYKAALVVVELMLLGLIYYVVTRGLRGHWQENWVEYRALAEMLRSTRSLAYLGVYGSVQRPGQLEPSSSAWFLWYLRATVRELGLPHAALGEEYLKKQLETVRKHVIEDQKKYHDPNVETVTRLHNVLKAIRNWSFFITVGVLLAFLLAYLVFVLGMLLDGKSPLAIIGAVEAHIVPHEWADVHDRLGMLGWFLYRAKAAVTYVAAFLPALVAAVAGIQETADFEGLALRSAKTANALTEIDKHIATIVKQPTLESTGAVLLSTAEVLTEDLGAWQSIYGRKHLGLP